MTSLLLSVGIAVFFLTVWGAVMAGANMIDKPVQAIITPSRANNAPASVPASARTQGNDLDESGPNARS